MAMMKVCIVCINQSFCDSKSRAFRFWTGGLTSKALGSCQ